MAREALAAAGWGSAGGWLRAWRVTDPAAWNAFVEATPVHHAFRWEWGEVRAMGGWRPVRLAIGPSHDEPVAGAQLLLRRSH